MYFRPGELQSLLLSESALLSELCVVPLVSMVCSSCKVVFVVVEKIPESELLAVRFVVMSKVSLESGTKRS